MNLEFQYQLCPTLLLADMEMGNPALAFLYGVEWSLQRNSGRLFFAVSFRHLFSEDEKHTRMGIRPRQGEG